MTTLGLEARRLQGEWMDRPDLEPRMHIGALRGLARINALSRTAATLAGPIMNMARESSEPLRVLDLATGGGDVPRALARRMKAAGLATMLSGCDRSAEAVAFARAQSRAGGEGVDFFVLDTLRDVLPREYDVIICSLFLHHLEDGAAEALLCRMAGAARRMVLVSDLKRTTSGLHLAYWATRLLSRSPIVHTDGPRSVQAAFTIREVAALAARAGLGGATIQSCWPQRYLLEWVKA